jgi:hypothetical protein
MTSDDAPWVGPRAAASRGHCSCRAFDHSWSSHVSEPFSLTFRTSPFGGRRCSTSSAYFPIELQRGRARRVEIKRNDDGSIDARVELRCHGVRRCLLVSLNQPMQGLAEDKLAERALDYVKRHSTGESASP